MGQTVNLTVDVTQMYGFSAAMVQLPLGMTKGLATAFQQIGRYDIETLKKKLPGTFNIRSKGLANSFKYKATDVSRATDFTKLFVSEYTGWKASQIFQSGGRVTGKGKNLTVLTPAALNANGRRKYTQGKLRLMIASGQIKYIRTPRVAFLVLNKGGLTKKGEMRRGSQSVILAVLKRSIVQKKRLEFFENAQANQGMHQDFMETAIENALADISVSKSAAK